MVKHNKRLTSRETFCSLNIERLEKNFTFFPYSKPRYLSQEPCPKLEIIFTK